MQSELHRHGNDIVKYTRYEDYSPEVGVVVGLDVGNQVGTDHINYDVLPNDQLMKIRLTSNQTVPEPWSNIFPTFMKQSKDELQLPKPGIMKWIHILHVKIFHSCSRF
jgi:hypothetical protein